MRRLLLAVSVLVGLAGAADAACDKTNVCTAADLASCCGGTTCTIDGVVTIANQPNCELDFDLTNVAIVPGGRIVVGAGNRLAIMAGSLRMTRGKLLANGSPGLAGKPGGEIAIQTSGEVLFESEAEIDVSGGGPGTGGGRFTVDAGDLVNVAAATFKAEGFDESLGGEIRLTAVGPISMMGNPLVIAAEGGGGGRVTIESEADVFIGDTGRIRTNVLDHGPGLGGTIEVTGDAVTSHAVMEAQGGSGDITLTARTGALVVDREIGGLTVDTDVDQAGTITLVTEALGAGTLRVDAPLSARGLDVDVGGGQIAIDSASTVAFSTDPQHTDTINVSGFGSGASELEVRAIGDVNLQGDIVGIDDPGSIVTVTSGRTVRFGGTITVTGRTDFDAEGGEVDVDADHDVIVEQGASIVATASGIADGGIIDLTAGHDLVIEAGGPGAPANLHADSGTTGGAGGGVELTAGATDFRGFEQTGDLELRGVVSAKASSAASDGGTVDLSGCEIEVTGTIDAGASAAATGAIAFIARKSLHVSSSATIKAAANTVLHPPGSPPVVDAGAMVTPALAPTARVACEDAPGDPVIGCLVPCPTCGDDTVEGPWEQCEPEAGKDHCAPPFCNDRCRIDADCDTTITCQDAFCDPNGGCFRLNEPNNTPCGATFCTGPMVCQAGSCEPTSPPPLDCECDEMNDVLCPDNDGEPCTVNRTCNGTTCVYEVLQAPECCHNDGECGAVQDCSRCDMETVLDPEANVCELIPNCCLADADCEDGNPCTENTCNGGTSQCNPPTPLNGPEPGCGEPLNPNDPPTCFVGAGCTAGVCDPGQPEACPDDGDPCTDEVADSSGCCVHPVISPSCCSAAQQTCPGQVNACTNVTCNETTNECEATVLPNCSPCTIIDDCPEPENPCASIACNQAAGVCIQTVDPTCVICETVDDCPQSNDPCRPAFCSDERGVCDRSLIPGCESCAADSTCNKSPDSPPSGACAEHRCVAGVCQPNGARPDCDDGNPASDDECVEVSGQGTCVHTCQDTSPCSDGDACNGVEDRVDCLCETVEPAPTLAAAVACQLGVFDGALAGLTPQQISKAHKKKMAKLAKTVRSKTQASTAGSTRARTKAVKTALTQLKALLKLLGKQKKIPPGTVATMRDALQKATAELNAVRAAIVS